MPLKTRSETAPVSDLLSVECCWESADALLAQLAERVASLPVPGTAASVTALSRLRWRLREVVEGVGRAALEGERLRDFAESLESLPF